MALICFSFAASAASVDGKWTAEGGRGGPQTFTFKADGNNVTGTLTTQRGDSPIADGKLSVIDGPFVEAKEVIGGYAVFELPGKEEAVASAVEFMQLHKDHLPGWEGTCELRAFAPGGP